MILNPPHIVTVLRSYRQFTRAGITGQNLEKALAISLLKCIARQDRHTWPDFQRLYHLYLQSIPLPLAQAAWGITQLESPTATQP